MSESSEICNPPTEAAVVQQHTHIYIIGAQCTGKTTLVAALQENISRIEPSTSKHSSSFGVVPEVARQVLQKLYLTGADILLSSDQALRIQEHILQGQFASEMAMKEKRYIADRSGIDAIVYAERYAGLAAVHKLVASKEWEVLQSRMNRSLIILCEPVRAWLEDDGLRLMPTCDGDWMSFHRLFIKTLESAELSYHILPSNLENIRDRVDFVLQRL